MRVRQFAVILAIVLSAMLCPVARTQGSLSVTGISPSSGPVGIPVTISGLNFGTSQEASTVSLNGTSVTVLNWTDTALSVLVPSGATSGTFAVTVDDEAAYSSQFTVTALPSGWSDQDIGSVGTAGSASYASDVFTVKGAGSGIGGTSDAMHFVYQSLSGDGTIIARVASVSGGYIPQAGLMIRQSLNANDENASVFYSSSATDFTWRASSGGSTSQSGNTRASVPEWLKLVRSGYTLSAYYSSDGLNWTQASGSPETVSMSTNVYVGLVVSSESTSELATATFDNVSVNSTATPAPVITSLSATTGSPLSQVTIYGSNFGSTQGSSLVDLNALPVTVNSWSATSVTITIPSGATSGPLVVSVGPSMNDSNHMEFAVTSNPLPTSWLDQDIGPVGLMGSATFSNGVFTIKGAGGGIGGTSDAMHFVYQALSGDGTIIARLASVSGGTIPEVTLMIRQTLTANDANASTYYSGSAVHFSWRATTGGGTSSGGTISVTIPVWLELVRSGNTFSAYKSSDGINWVQLGSSPQTVTMATNVYVGFAVSADSTSSLTTATFDNVSINSTASPAPVITSVSATTGNAGTPVEITGSGFGDFQESSLVFLNDAPVTVNSWSPTEIVITIPSGATSGPLVVSVGPSMNDSNPVEFTVTSTPLPISILDQDVGIVGLAGSATYSNNVVTIKGAGDFGTTTDQMHFVYQPLSGDGTIIARVASTSGGYIPQVGLEIRQSLASNDLNAAVYYSSSAVNFTWRTSVGGSTASNGTKAASVPVWLELTRSGNTLSAYYSSDGVNWVPASGSPETVTMSSNVYIGLFVSNTVSTSLATATFDNVSVSSTNSPAPVITGVSATTGSVGSQVEISGTGFGNSQGSSLVFLSDSPVTINSWSNTSIIATIPSGATTGPLVVSVGPTMNDSNDVVFTVTSQPLPTPWLDQDVGTVKSAGSATYSSGVFTVKGTGSIGGTADAMHYVYQPLSGDGSLTARLVSVSGGSSPTAGVMIRETLNANATNGYTFDQSYAWFSWRPTTGGTTDTNGNLTASLPLWVEVIRTGNTFYGYTSTDGVNWHQGSGWTETFAMAQNVYVGFAVAGGTSLTTATFDNLNVTVGTTPFVTGLSPVLGGIGSSVTIAGSNFGATQGTSSVAFNGVAATSITSWSDTQIVATVPAGASTGQVAVTVNSITSPGNPTYTVVNPVITSLTPSVGPPQGQVTINGTGFGNYPQNVYFNGLSAGITSWTDTAISATVPQAATSGPVTVVEEGVTSNGANFTVESISVTGVAPSSGPVGDTVTITGSGFGSTQGSSYATFDGVTATVTNWSDSSITAVVPSGAGTGPVTVDVAGIEGDGPSFTITSGMVLTDSLGHQTSYSSEISGGMWYVSQSQGSGCATCDIRGNVTYQYDNFGNILSITDPRGYTTSETYNPNNDVASITQPAVSGGTPTTSYTYNKFGEVLTMTDALGHVTTNTYDSHGNLLTVTTPPPNGNTAASVTQFAYNSLGELTQITDPLGNVTNIAYTPHGYIASITDAQQNTTSYGYDSRGNRTSITDPMNHQTMFTYDTGNRLTQITYPDQSTVSFGYDYRGRRTSVTDQNNKTTTYAYDDADRLTSVTDPAGNITQYGYDTENNLTSITDANNHTTNFQYDAYGRVTQTTFPSNYFETYGYDADNNLTSKTDRNSNTIQYVYDALNRLTEKDYPNSTSADYTYDLVGKILQANDPTGTYAFAYDNMGRLIGTTTTYSFLPNIPFTNSYSYDADSNRTGYTAPGGSTNTYGYDTLNRLTTLANSWAGSFGFSYDSLSRRTQMTRPNGITTNYAYDSLSRLLSVLHQAGASTIDGDVYTLDPAGNRTSKQDELAGVTSNYTYDKIYELTQVTQGANTTESYSYDPVGNRTASLAIPSYTVNSSNELASDSNASYTYDNNGNTTSKTDSTGITNYTWDFENRLTSVILPGSGGTASFKYDPFGRRIQKTFTQNGTTTTTNYLYNGDNVVETTDQNGSITAKFAQGQNIDEPLAESTSGSTDYYEADGLGSITSLTSATGSIAQTYTYDSFGNTTNSSGTVANPFRYTSRDFDSETGLYYYRARYFDQGTGRFLSEDPARLSAGDINFYRYAWNAPAGYIDPTGRNGLLISVGATGGIAADRALNAGTAGTANVATGLLWGNPNGVGPLGLKAALVNTVGGYAHLGRSRASFPCTCGSASKPSGMGVAASVGGGITYVTGANDSSQLAGPFSTTVIGLGVIELQYSTAGGVRTYSASAGPGLSVGFFRFKTLTYDMTEPGAPTPQSGCN